MSSAWTHVPRNGRKIAKMFPVKTLNRLNICFIPGGCKNRPFFTIQVKNNQLHPHTPGIEQIGSYDPMPNAFGEKILGIDMERLLHWLSKGAKPNRTVKEILGVAGLLPFDTHTQLDLLRKKKKEVVDLAKLENDSTNPVIEENVVPES